MNTHTHKYWAEILNLAPHVYTTCCATDNVYHIQKCTNLWFGWATTSLCWLYRLSTQTKDAEYEKSTMKKKKKSNKSHWIDENERRRLCSEPCKSYFQFRHLTVIRFSRKLCTHNYIRYSYILPGESIIYKRITSHVLTARALSHFLPSPMPSLSSVDTALHVFMFQFQFCVQWKESLIGSFSLNMIPKWCDTGASILT